LSSNIVYMLLCPINKCLSKLTKLLYVVWYREQINLNIMINAFINELCFHGCKHYTYWL